MFNGTEFPLDVMEGCGNSGGGCMAANVINSTELYTQT